MTDCLYLCVCLSVCAVDGAAEYMAEGLRRDLMSREFREPATTAEVRPDLLWHSHPLP